VSILIISITQNFYKHLSIPSVAVFTMIVFIGPHPSPNVSNLTNTEQCGYPRNRRRFVLVVLILAIVLATQNIYSREWLLGWLAESSNNSSPDRELLTGTIVVQDEAPTVMENREYERVVSGQGQEWERMYAFASVEAKTPDHCGGRGRAIPMFADGVAAGPLLCMTWPFSAVGQEQEQEETSKHSSIEECAQTIHDLDAYKMLASGEALRLVLDPVSAKTHANVVKDRERHSGASGAVFLDDEHFCVVSFGHSMVYLYHYNAATMEATLLDKVLNKFPGGAEGGEFTELIDYDGKNMLVTGNLRTATTTLFSIDWTTKKMQLVQGAFVFADVRKVDKQMTHGARFYPSSTSSIVVATAQFKKFPNSLMVRFYNWRTETTVAELRMKNTRHAGMGPQDIFFIDKHNMLVAFTPKNVDPPGQTHWQRVSSITVWTLILMMKMVTSS
jgi:hypothetical protein